MPSNIIYSCFSYNKNGETIYCRCNRSLTHKCTARLVLNNDFITTKGNHCCKQIRSEKADIPELETSPNDFVDKFIKEKDSKANLYPNAIYQDFKNIHPYNIPSKDKIFSKVREIRKTQDLSSIQSVTSPPVYYKENGQPFLRRLWTGDIYNEYSTAMIWATNITLGLLRYNSNVFIDATFRATSKDFLQCLVIRTFDLGTQTLVPCAYALRTGKLEHLYSVVLHEMIFLLEFKWMPKYITNHRL
ncbi:hypothetical protein HZS_2035 [Henneguya salminicola]|nr:hypothetical protein HZS_2035 [Henneguya salminicola]